MTSSVKLLGLGSRSGVSIPVFNFCSIASICSVFEHLGRVVPIPPTFFLLLSLFSLGALREVSGALSLGLRLIGIPIVLRDC